MRHKIWDMVFDLIDERYHDLVILHYEGITKWEDEIKDIVESIEELAGSIEQHIIEQNRYQCEDEAEDAGCDKYHKRAEEGK